MYRNAPLLRQSMGHTQSVSDGAILRERISLDQGPNLYPIFAYFV